MLKLEDILNIISSSTEIESSKVNINTSSENLEEWDSLAHLAILTAIDKKTNGKTASISNLSEATSVDSILEILREHGLAE